MEYNNLIFSGIDSVYGYNLTNNEFYINGDLKSAVIIVKSESPFTDDELRRLDEYGKILTDQMRKVRGEVLGGNYYFIKKCDGEFECKKRTWDNSRYYDDFAQFLDHYIDK